MILNLNEKPLPELEDFELEWELESEVFPYADAFELDSELELVAPEAPLASSQGSAFAMAIALGLAKAIATALALAIGAELATMESDSKIEMIWDVESFIFNWFCE
ncbi:unnamed protein product [Ambrosiozyma monospora]|uniref:Unnamed protein product n=1 Tax=Ambrosiozyma monospora TaxID=43982 RepID=A0A9W6YYR9_AMBMO|nr:unnamed protein product [Ambrosiozyma monospora]